jgi:hypothetical protein
MNQPIPRGGTEPLRVGDRVQIVPEWQDPGDEWFDRFVIEAPQNTTQVRIRAIIPGSPSTLALQGYTLAEVDALESYRDNAQRVIYVREMERRGIEFQGEPLNASADFATA